MKDKIEIYAMVGDALQSANGLRHQVQEIQKAFNCHENLKRSMEWLGMIDYGLAKMRKGLDECIVWTEMEGTGNQP